MFTDDEGIDARKIFLIYYVERNIYIFFNFDKIPLICNLIKI